jgi:hypothetical protein
VKGIFFADKVNTPAVLSGKKLMPLGQAKAAEIY